LGTLKKPAKHLKLSSPVGIDHFTYNWKNFVYRMVHFRVCCQHYTGRNSNPVYAHLSNDYCILETMFCKKYLWFHDWIQ
jgi:hypothetical protein